MKKQLLPIIVLVLFALAVLLGLYRYDGRFLGSNSISVASDKTLEEYYQTAKDLAQNEFPPKETAFLSVGDIMLSRSVAAAIKKAGDPNWPFKNIAGLLSQTSFNFGNLESPLSPGTQFNPSGDMNFNVPPGFADGLIKYNFRVLNLANNHAFDQGRMGLDYTRKFLNNNKIVHVGIGETTDEAWQGQIVEASGIKIGFIGATYGVQAGGSNYAALIKDAAKLRSAINELEEKTDFIVVAMHAGEEYKRKPNKAQVDFARAAIDAGADMVIGHHPHWIQPMEVYNEKYIFYSLGNFIFDQGWSQETKEGLTLKITLAGTPKRSSNVASIEMLQGTKTGVNLKQIELIPVIIENYGQPRVASPEETITILKKINIDSPILVP